MSATFSVTTHLYHNSDPKRKKSSGEKNGRQKRNKRKLSGNEDIITNSSDSDTPAKKKSRSIQHLSLTSQGILNLAYEAYKAELSKTNPWPDEPKHEGDEPAMVDKITSMTMGAWYKACDMKDIKDQEPTIEELKRIKDRTSQFRGQLKDKAKELVPKTYGLIDPKSLIDPTPEEIEATKEDNRVIVEAHKKNKFWYKDPTNTSLPNSLFRAPIIQQLFNYNWFSVGTFSRGSYFAGETKVPLVTLALIMTAVDFVFDSWTTGQYSPIKFSADKYAPRYHKNFERLQKWKAFTEKEEDDLANMLQEEFLRNAKAAVGLPLQVKQEGEETDEETMLAAFRANQAI